MASGSDKRQRGKTVTVRLSDEEHAALDGLASRSGLAVGAFMRAAAFGEAGPRAQRRPPADHVALRQILGNCGRIGNNLNQIAKHLNAGGQAEIPELVVSLSAYGDISKAILAALNMKSGDGPDPLDPDPLGPDPLADPP